MASGDDVSTRTRGISLGLNPNFTSQIALLLLTPQLPPIVRAPPASQSAPSPSRLRCLRPALSSRTPCEPEPSCFFPPPERRARPSAWRMRTMSCQAYLKGSRRNAVAGGLGGGFPFLNAYLWSPPVFFSSSAKPEGSPSILIGSKAQAGDRVNLHCSRFTPPVMEAFWDLEAAPG